MQAKAPPKRQYLEQPRGAASLPSADTTAADASPNHEAADGGNTLPSFLRPSPRDRSSKSKSKRKSARLQGILTKPSAKSKSQRLSKQIAHLKQLSSTRQGRAGQLSDAIKNEPRRYKDSLPTHSLSMRALLIQRDNQSLIEENVDLRTKCKQATEELARVTTSRDDLMAHISSLFEARADRQAYEVKVRQLSANVDTLLQVNANAKDKNVSRSMTIQELREHTHVLERQVAEYKQRMESVIASHKECGGKIVAAQQSTRNVEQESARQKARADALTLESRKHSLRAAFLDQDLKKAKTAHTTLQTEHSELQRVHEAMAVENKTVSQSNMHLDLCVGELRKHKKTLNERVAGHVERETELEVLIKARDASIAGLGSQGALTQKSLDSTAQQLSTARQQLADQQTQHAEVVAKLKKMRGEFSITKKQLAATKTQLSEATLTANALQDAHQGCTAAIIKLENVRSAYEDTLPVTAALENEVKTLKDTLAEVVQANAGKVQDIHRQDGLLKQLRQDIHEMRMGKEAKEAAYEAMAIEFSKLNQDTDKLQKEEAQVRMELQLLTQKHEALASSHARCNENLEIATRRAGESTAEVQVLQRQAASAETVIEQAKASSAAAASTIDSLRKQILDLTYENRALEMDTENSQRAVRASQNEYAQLTQKQAELEPLLAYAMTERDAVQTQNKALLMEKKSNTKELEALREIVQRHAKCGPALASSTEKLFNATEALAKQKAETESTIQHSFVAIEAHKDCEGRITELRSAVGVLEHRLAGEREKVGVLDKELNSLRLAEDNEEQTPET